MTIEKNFDAVSPYLYKAVAKEKTLQSAELRWYRINDAGKEEVYFTMLPEGVKVVGVNPNMPNTKTGPEAINHLENVSLMYDSITWHHANGSIKFADAREER